ncbi:nuclear transcription factor Y subunit alpha-like [Haliotis cracherodii]|uniref:nuclear transcription factor Y subunit alpha-like n=1 Tax=Haliotis rufescens TaxID=6454 RepID=UPI001EB034BF|nr:nuclear transcription factor Y subunit alpha-like [Haliotis rufescens]XP_046365164.1 nuclear transcription factor Y subunit alpha-like [Haliotis rufescens]XP_046365165.1 nuclear transcription factor Y subunit alpha-like [Haliotis rufescens]
MAEAEQYTVYEADSQQPLTVTVNPEDGQAVQHVQGIQYITQDGVQVAQLHGQPGVIQVSDAQTIYTTQGGSSFTSLASTPSTQVVANAANVIASSGQTIVQPTSVVQQGANVIGTQSVIQGNGTTTINPGGIPQMLFLNQVTINGQTSFVLVDANNKPVQLPQGIQVINLPSQQTGGQQLPMPGSESGDEPLYVNAKQYHRILKRRQARAKLESLGKIPKERQKYLYESRHRHAMNRQRGSGGVFVGGEEDGPQPNIKPLDGKNNHQVFQETQVLHSDGGPVIHHTGQAAEMLTTLGT